MKTGRLTGAGRKSAADGEQIKLNGESLGGKKKKKEKKRGGGGWGWGLDGCRNSSQDKWCVLQGHCGTMCALETGMSDVIVNRCYWWSSDGTHTRIEPNSVQKSGNLTAW